MELCTDSSGLKPYAFTPTSVVTEDMGGEKMILDLQQSRYCSLNGVGSRMFALVQEEATLDEAVQVLAAEYAADPDTIRGDLVELIDRLVQEGLLVINE